MLAWWLWRQRHAAAPRVVAQRRRQPVTTAPHGTIAPAGIGAPYRGPTMQDGQTPAQVARTVPPAPASSSPAKAPPVPVYVPAYDGAPAAALPAFGGAFLATTPVVSLEDSGTPAAPEVRATVIGADTGNLVELSPAARALSGADALDAADAKYWEWIASQDVGLINMPAPDPIILDAGGAPLPSSSPLPFPNDWPGPWGNGPIEIVMLPDPPAPDPIDVSPLPEMSAPDQSYAGFSGDYQTWWQLENEMSGDTYAPG